MLHPWMATSEIQIGQFINNIYLAVFLGQVTQPGFLKPQLLLRPPAGFAKFTRSLRCTISDMSHR